MAKSKRQTVKKILFDSAMIIFSVLLALFIDEWRTSYNQRVVTDKMLENIRIEISDNQKFVKNAITYQESVLKKTERIFEQDSLKELMYSNTYGFTIRDVAPNGVAQGNIYDIAWTVAKEDKITNRISLEKSKALFAVYEQHKNINNGIDDIVSVLLSREALKEENLRGTAILYISATQELLGRLKYLNMLYSDALEVLDE